MMKDRRRNRTRREGEDVSLRSGMDVGLHRSFLLLLFPLHLLLCHHPCCQQIFLAVLLSVKLNLQLLFNKEPRSSEQNGREGG